MNYDDFISGKHIKIDDAGFDPKPIGNYLFPFQRHAVQFAIKKGRAALFLNTGLGKTRSQLEFARQVATHTQGRVLILAPLAVSSQTVREGAAIGIPLVYAKTGEESASDIVITNYERMRGFNIADFSGIILDESSILKSIDGKLKKEIIGGFRATPYKLACTATPAPNDHKELGNHAEFLGVMSSNEMLSRWFLNDAADTGEWRLKGHAVDDFWRWVSSWAMMAELPSDLGPFSNDGYILPPLRKFDHIVDVDTSREIGDLTLFRIPDTSIAGLHGELRRTATARAAKIASIVAAEPNEQWLIWCDTDYEADALASSIDGAVEVRGSHTSDAKEARLNDFADGRIRTMITKPKIAGFGMNFQGCARVAFVGATYSFESRYQAIRRTWRFGQKRDVHVHSVMAHTEAPIWQALNTKEEAFERMKTNMVKAAIKAQSIQLSSSKYNANEFMKIPAWLSEVSQ